MGHLNELMETYGEKGLYVMSVTQEPRSAVEAYATATKAATPIMIEASNTKGIFGVTSIPSAALIGPSGRILWTGHPGNLSDSELRGHLDAAKILPELPKALKSVGKALSKDKFADARKKAAAATTDEDEAIAATATQVVEWIDWYGTSLLEGATKDTEADNAYGAWLSLDMLSSAYKGLEVGDTAKTQLKALMGDKGRKNEVKAGQKLDKLILQLADMSPNKAVKAVEGYLRKYEETKAGARATAMLADLNRG